MFSKWLDKLNRQDYPFIDLFYYLIVIVVFFLLVIISSIFLINLTAQQGYLPFENAGNSQSQAGANQS